ncbi:MAG: ZIP family metal transporter [Lachnospiraceae bacterium]|nr:ZIP family metal transporter [Lachnospiraceae bacterium]MDD7378348.1 ZIP family metal transporter [Lachnospiraceae bacterium]MDY4618134.1 ZIP family metal transporter [Lachnospiraceae bacterium]
MQILIGIFIPFVGTALGAACVFFMKDAMNQNIQKALLGFASGVMVAASVWSLLIPAIEMSEDKGQLAFLPAAIGFVLGILFLLGMDHLIPHLHMDSDVPEGMPSKLKKTTMMVLAVTLHNIPEGMAVGVVFAGAITGEEGVTLAGALTLALGIAIQNFPEGAIVSMPLVTEGNSRGKAYLYGMLSGIVEPIAAGITIVLLGLVTPMLPYLLAFAAGAMIYVVVEELLPEASAGEHTNISTIGFATGFLIMMILDVALG